eukprot:4848181-Pyramimonas_sp.AAC.1
MLAPNERRKDERVVRRLTATVGAKRSPREPIKIRVKRTMKVSKPRIQGVLGTDSKLVLIVRGSGETIISMAEQRFRQERTKRRR